MPAISICTATDVIRRFGGQAAVTETIPDGNNPSTYDATLLAQIIVDSSEEIAARGNVQVDIQALAAAVAAGTTTWPPYLVDLVAWLCVSKVWDSGTKGQAKPDNVRDKERYILDVECEKLRKRQISLGAPTQYPATNQIHRRVDNDPQQVRMTRNAFRVRGGFG